MSFSTCHTVCHFKHFKVYNSGPFSTFTMLCNHQDCLFQNMSSPQKEFTKQSLLIPPSPSCWKPLIFPSLWICLFLVFPVSSNRTIQGILWLISNSTWYIHKRIENEFKQIFYMNVYNSTVHNSQKVGKKFKSLSTDEWKNKCGISTDWNIIQP